jgi:hypothetical protein
MYYFYVLPHLRGGDGAKVVRIAVGIDTAKSPRHTPDLESTHSWGDIMHAARQRHTRRAIRAEDDVASSFYFTSVPTSNGKLATKNLAKYDFVTKVHSWGNLVFHGCILLFLHN